MAPPGPQSTLSSVKANKNPKREMNYVFYLWFRVQSFIWNKNLRGNALIPNKIGIQPHKLVPLILVFSSSPIILYLVVKLVLPYNSYSILFYYFLGPSHVWVICARLRVSEVILTLSHLDWRLLMLQ